ncbi:amidohydrolase family protein [Nocardia sp. NPDC056000]|uniref:amidohydrolase family protein n=1 Tax=Nocardia sp. NPDC056000 TaxID=3345674 RepID=UPI0035E031A5
MRIDFHSHYLPPRFFDTMDSLDARARVDSFAHYGAHLTAAARRQFAAGDAAFIERWIGDMDSAGIDLTVMSVGAVQPYFPDAGSGITATRYANEMMREAVTAGAGRLGAFGSLPLPHIAATLAEIDFCFDECGFRGVNLGPSVAGRPLDAPEFDDIWAALNERSATVFLHPGATPQMAPGSAEFMLTPAFCGPTEMAIALCRLVAAKVPLRFPNVRVIGGITGGTIPYLFGRWDRGLRAADPELHAELGGVLGQLRRFWYDTSLIEDPYLFGTMRDSLGLDRLVLGSDTPREPATVAVDLVRNAEQLTAAEKTAILDSNGAAAYGLTEGR